MIRPYKNTISVLFYLRLFCTFILHTCREKWCLRHQKIVSKNIWEHVFHRRKSQTLLLKVFDSTLEYVHTLPGEGI